MKSLYNKDTCYLIGIILACGNIYQDTTYVYITQYLWDSFMAPLLRRYSIMFRKSNWHDDIVRVDWRTTGLFPVDSLMISNDGKKNIVVHDIFELDDECKQGLIDGFIDASGHRTSLYIHNMELVSGIARLLDLLHCTYNQTCFPTREITIPDKHGTLRKSLGYTVLTIC